MQGTAQTYCTAGAERDNRGASKLLKVYGNSKQGPYSRPPFLPPCFQFLQRLQSIPISLGPHPPMKPPANFKYSRVHWELYICKAALAGWAVRYLNPRNQRQRQRPADLCWVIVWGQLSFHSKFQASRAIKREPVSKVNKQINKCDLSNI